MKVARSIVGASDAFLEHGEEIMATDDPQGHRAGHRHARSTISRVTSSKYMHTPRGVFELKYFFSSHVEAADGGAPRRRRCAPRIRKLIKEEDSGNPLSDSRIAELLSGEGIAVARRTVAKYREALGLATLERTQGKGSS